VLFSPIVAGFLSTHNNEEEAFNWVSPFISYNNVDIRAGYNKVCRLLFSEPNCLQQTFGYTRFADWNVGQRRVLMLDAEEASSLGAG
jgi:hypothetical protein